MHLRIVLLFMLLLPGLAPAATYYVSPAGSDSTACASAQSRATPKQSVNGGVTCLGPGDTLLVLPGVYAESLGNTPASYPYCCGTNACTDVPVPSGTPGNPVTIKAETPRTAILRPPNRNCFYSIIYPAGVQWLVLDGLVTDSVHQTAYGQDVDIRDDHGQDPGHITLQNMEITRSGNHGIAGVCGVGLTMSYHSSDYVIRNNSIHDLGGADLDGCYGIYYHASNGLIEGNEIYNTMSHGIHFYNIQAVGGDNSNNVFRNNVIYNNRSRGFLLASAGRGNQIYNNILYNNGTGDNRGGLVIGCYGPSADVEVYNNTIVGNTGWAIRNCAPNTLVRNNILWSNTQNGISPEGSGTMDHNLIGIDPLFVNAAAADYHLQPGSPARAAGVPMPGISTPSGGPPDLGALQGLSPTGLPGPRPPLPTPQNVRLLPIP